MKARLVVPFPLVMLMAAGNAAAGEHESSKEEVIGVGSGVVVGALAGGPIGAVVGAVAGVIIGDKLNRTDEARVTALAERDQSEARLAALRATLELSQSEVARLVREMQDARRLAADLRFDIGFRTNDSSLGGDVDRQLADLAAVLQAYPGLRVRLDGHADPRGTEIDNDRLAAARVAAVRERLIEAGVGAQRIEAQAHGERASRAAEGDLDGYAFERRVSISLMPDEGAVARNR